VADGEATAWKPPLPVPCEPKSLRAPPYHPGLKYPGNCHRSPVTSTPSSLAPRGTAPTVCPVFPVGFPRPLRYSRRSPLKSFFILLVLSAAGLAGVLYWRRSLHPPAAPVTATGHPAKEAKDRHHRHKRGARRLARNEVFVASAPPPGETSAPGGAPDDTTPTLAPPPPEKERAPLAPGGAATTESGPSGGFDPLSSPAPATSPSPTGGRHQPIAEAEPEPVKLRPGDLKMVWQGEDLSRAENMRLDFSKDAVGHELSQDEIDARFHTKEDGILGCVARARPDEYTFVPGRVTVRFRILATGAVKGVQVEAPVILQRGGITGCIKGVMGGLRFPASNMPQVISYPFTLM
jgi:hypothetical protein